MDLVGLDHSEVGFFGFDGYGWHRSLQQALGLAKYIDRRDDRVDSSGDRFGVEDSIREYVGKGLYRSKLMRLEFKGNRTEMVLYCIEVFLLLKVLVLGYSCHPV